MQDGPLQRYRQMVQGRELAPDTSQELAAEKTFYTKVGDQICGVGYYKK